MSRSELHALVLEVGLAGLFAMLVAALGFTARNWSVDAERADSAHRSAVKALWYGGFSALGTLAILEGPTPLFGFFSLLDGRAGRPFLVATFVGWMTVALLTDGYRSRWGLALNFASGLLCFLLLRTVAGFAPTFTVAVFGLFSLFASAHVVPRQKPVEVKGILWVENLFNRGGWLTTLHWVRWRFWAQARASGEECVQFGFSDLPVQNVLGHFLIAGAPGTGKTIAFRLLMQSVLPTLGNAHRAILFDAKHEQVSVVQGMGLKPLILNPFDARCSVWDVAQDFRTPSDALQLAKLLLQDNPKESEPFWRNSARGLLSDVILAHILAFGGGRLPTWTLSDILRALQSRKDIENALSMDPRTEDSLRNIGEERTLAGILATLDLVRREFEVLGALWDEPWESPERRFSLTQWSKGGGVMVLAPSTMAEEVTGPLNRLLLDRVGQLVLNRPEEANSTPSRTWLFLDEFPRLGKMPRIESLMTNGRSKGLVAVLGVQDVSDVKHHYGKEQAATLLGCCAHRMLFQAGSHEHAEWCTQNIGSAEVIQLRRSTGTTSTTGTSSSFSKSISTSAEERMRPLFTTDEYRLLGKPGIRTPLRVPSPWLERLLPRVPFLKAWFGISYFSPVRAVCSVQNLTYEVEIPFIATTESLWPKVGEDFVPRPDADQFLKPWGDDPALPPPAEVPPTSGTGNPSIVEALWQISPRKR